eukprot:TRINITY_DN29006_c0_g1_i1.p1 TRINITY_DN29006_c0_g1~~TRINITY_DN29006_c0_g1_i1.p1  ORF type:complete len:1241 (-),score=209.24 TRINITY_DN29006_c0_g1_i1:136-3831(-)
MARRYADMERTEESDSSSDEENDLRQQRRTYILFMLSLVGICSLSAFVVCLVGFSTTFGKRLKPSEFVELDQPDVGVPIGAPKCNNENDNYFYFSDLGSDVPSARSALRHLILQTRERMLRCQPPQSSDIMPESDQSVRMAWKYARDCQSVTYRATVVVKSPDTTGTQSANSDTGDRNNGYSWQGQINYVPASQRWMLLEETLRPAPCSIAGSDEANVLPISDPTKDDHVMAAANFMVNQMNFLRRQRQCDSGGQLTLNTIQQARSQVASEIIYDLELKLNVPDASGATQQVTAFGTVSDYVLESPSPMIFAPGVRGQNIYDVCSDPNTWGAFRRLGAASAVEDGWAPQRFTFGAVEGQASDPTQRLTRFNQYFFGHERTGRQLSSDVLPPIMLRHITRGNVPTEYDPRNDQIVRGCFDLYPILDQGSCGCCYSTAMAVMFGLRKCILEHRKQIAATVPARRLIEVGNGDTAISGCTDVATWSNHDGRSCAWYAEDPARCVLNPDVGQLSYCQVTCHSCPNMVVAEAQDPSMINYMYSSQDIATCSCSDVNFDDMNVESNCYEQSGCQGGSMWGVWDDWMRLTSRKLRRRDCMPLSIKCLESAGVTNPLISSDSCLAFAGFDTWDQPCECIDGAKKPASVPQCQRQEDSCTTLDKPLMIYKLASSTDGGLSLAQTVRNMQRHIFEQGPIYVAFDVTREFENFFMSSGRGSNGDVFADASGTVLGGHAVVIIGWGQTTAEQPMGVGSGQTFWWMRNSWGNTWALNGHGKIIAYRNLMKIEDRMAAAMMDEYADFTGPTCTGKRTYQRLKSYNNGVLCYLELELDIMCSEEATLKVIWGSRKIEGDMKASDYDDVYETPLFRCKRGVTCKISGFDLLYAGFGLERKALQVNIWAFDSSGNQNSVRHTLESFPVQGATSVGGQRACGVPEAACTAGCRTPAWDMPPAAPNDTSAPPLPSSQARVDEGTDAPPAMPSGFCFPPSSNVRVASGDDMPASLLRPGIELLAPGGVSSTYLQDFHEGVAGRHDVMTKYLQIDHSLQRPGQPLLISSNHLLRLVGNAGKRAPWRFVPAAELRVGDEVLALDADGSEKASAVLGISEVVRAGFVAPLASSGQLWVEGVLVSSYALLTEGQLRLWRHGPVGLREGTQEICHTLAAPLRGLAALRPLMAALTAASGPVSWALRWMLGGSGGGEAVGKESQLADVADAATASFLAGYLELISGTFDGIGHLLSV